MSLVHAMKCCLSKTFVALENARSTKDWTGPVQCFTAETDRWFSTGPRLRPRSQLHIDTNTSPASHIRIVGSAALSTSGQNVTTCSRRAPGHGILNRSR